MAKYEEMEAAHPEREIDDTNGWEIQSFVRVMFWQRKPCRHARKVKSDDDREYVLPRTLLTLAQCYVGSTVCLDCLLESVQGGEK